MGRGNLNILIILYKNIPRKVANYVFSVSNEHQEQGAKVRNSRLLQA